MSGTEEYYFGKKWAGIEKVGKFLDKKHIQNFKSSHALSFGEEMAMLSEVIEKIIHLQNEIRESLGESKLSDRDVYTELTNKSKIELGTC